MPTTSLMPLPKQQYLSALGTPLVGGKVYTYAAGTNNPKAAYTDAAGTTPHENPITLNVRGEPPSPIYWSGNYRVDVRDALGNLVYTVDNYNTDPAGTWAIVTNLAKAAGATMIGFLQAGAGAILRTIYDKLFDIPTVEDFGAVDGQDSTDAIQKAVNARVAVWVPPGKTYYVNSITIPGGHRIRLDGTLSRIANAPSDSFMITNASGAAGDSNIIIEGRGELDGNLAAQSGDRQGLVKFQKPTNCLIDIRKAGGNRYDATNPVVSGQGCIVFTDATRSHIRVRDLVLWQREGLFIDGASTQCSIKDVTALGDGLNSWTAVSISGAGAAYNEISGIVADTCGASSVGCDSTYSQVSKIISRNNKFQNGVNFGHTGKPATGSRAWDITVLNAGSGATSGSTHCGIQVGGGTTDFDLSNITVAGAYNHCLQVSDGSTRFQLGGKNRLTGALHGSGVNTFGADQVRISGVTASGNSDYGVNINAANDSLVLDCDLRGNTIRGFSATGSRVRLVNSPCSADGISGTINLNAAGDLAAGGTFTLSNNNIFGFYTEIKFNPRDAAVAAAQPYLITQTTGSATFGVVGAVSSVGAPHNLGYAIL